MNCLENGEILLKGTTKKVNSQKGELLIFLRPLISVGLPLMKNILTPFAKSVLVFLGLKAAVSVTDAVIQNKILGSGKALIIFDEEMNDIMKIVKFLEDYGLLIKVLAKQLKMKQKNKKVDLLESC